MRARARERDAQGDGLGSGGNTSAKVVKTASKRKGKNSSPFYLRKPPEETVFQQ